MLGTMLRGRYEIIRKLGQGGFSETYLAQDKDLPGNPHCVVKQLNPMFSGAFVLQTARRLFDREAQVLYRLGNHDQIPRLLAHFEEDGQFYLVQEFIDGSVLSQELTSSRQWSEDEVITFLQDILKVLEFVHQQGVIHRDIKPSNLIRRSSDNKLILIDFGAVKEIGSLGGNFQGLTVVGTPGYMPSEQSSGNPQFSSDIYALGMTAIQALTGVLPNQFSKHTSTNEILWQNFVRVRPQLANILDKMVRYDFRQRYQSADEVLQALTSLTKIESQSLTKIIAFALGAFALTFSVTILTIPQIRQIFVGLTPIHLSSADIDFKIYNNDSYGIRIKYPQTWIKQDIGTFGDVVKFVSPVKSHSNSFPAELTIETENLKEPVLLAEYTNLKVNEITQYLMNAKIHDSHSTQLSNQLAHQVIYSGKQDRYSLKRKAVWLLKNNKAYIITYTAEESQYDSYLNTAQVMMNSLEIR